MDAHAANSVAAALLLNPTGGGTSSTPAGGGTGASRVSSGSGIMAGRPSARADHIYRHLSGQLRVIADSSAPEVEEASRRASAAATAEFFSTLPAASPLARASSMRHAVGGGAPPVATGDVAIALPPTASASSLTGMGAGGVGAGGPGMGALEEEGGPDKEEGGPDADAALSPRKVMHALTQQLLSQLKVDAEHGLTGAEATHRLSVYGVNELEKDSQPPIWKLFLSQFMNLIIVMLLAACVASFALEEIPEGVAILIIVLINASIATYTEHSSGNALAKLSSMSKPISTVIRDGQELKVPTPEIVPGDIVLIATGDIVPADGRLLHSVDLKVDEMILTGESVDVVKSAMSPAIGPAAAVARPLAELIARAASKKLAGTKSASAALPPPPPAALPTGDATMNALVPAAPSGATASGVGAGHGGEEALTSAAEVYSSTKVTSGNGMLLVTRTGMQTMVGSIAEQLRSSAGNRNCLGLETPQLSPMQRKLHHLGLVLSAIALTGCVLVFVIGVVRDYRDPKAPDSSPILTMVLVAVSLAVSAAPEGLPLVQTITLAVGTFEMAKEHALIRHLPAVETLGSTQVVCSDKTGTLTEGKMTALKMVGWSADEHGMGAPRLIDITGRGLVPVGEFLEKGAIITDPDAGIMDVWVRSTLLSALLNSTAQLKIQTDPKDSSQVRDLSLDDTRNFEEKAVQLRFRVEGNSSEAPLVIAAAKANLFAVQVEALYPTLRATMSGKSGPEVPFSSSRKMMATIVSVNDERLGDLVVPPNTNWVVLVKGAPNYVMQHCTHYVNRDARVTPFGERKEEAHKQLMECVDDLSMQALRVLAVAVRPLEHIPFDVHDTELPADVKCDLLCRDLAFSGLFASMDPEREGVDDAIAAARAAGIRTIMITGDYLKTAIAIAKNIDLITIRDQADEVAVDCNVLRPYGTEYLPNHDLDEITSRAVVFARAKPEDKLVIVRSLQRQGFITAMTGDGVNDAPALNEADIGVAMGLNGTEVAKGAADMVLLDDDFSTIIVSVRRGRIIYDNIQKFVVYLLGTNMAGILTILTGISIGLPAVFEALPILILNVLCDGSVAMTMSLEPGDPGVMKRPPRPPTEPLVGARQWTTIFTHAAFLAACVLGSFATGLYWQIGLLTISDLQPDGKRISRDPLTCNVWSPANTDRIAVTDTHCTAFGIEVARGMAFITIAFTEILRGFTARSVKPFWNKPFSNRAMLRAMLFAITLALCILMIPGLRGIFGFEWMEWYHWLTAFAFVVPTLIMDEVLKALFRGMDRMRRAYRSVVSSFNAIENELRQLRHQMTGIEDKLQLREHKPAHARPEAVESARLLARSIEQLQAGLTERISDDVIQQLRGVATRDAANRRAVMFHGADSFTAAKLGTGPQAGARGATSRAPFGASRGAALGRHAAAGAAGAPGAVPLTAQEMRILQTRLLKASVRGLALPGATPASGAHVAGDSSDSGLRRASGSDTIFAHTVPTDTVLALMHDLPLSTPQHEVAAAHEHTAPVPGADDEDAIARSKSAAPVMISAELQAAIDDARAARASPAGAAAPSAAARGASRTGRTWVDLGSAQPSDAAPKASPSAGDS